jgi:sulfite reductase alpha subunit-like flavoprotein
MADKLHAEQEKLERRVAEATAASEAAEAERKAAVSELAELHARRATMADKVALVYGSFNQGDCKQDVDKIYEAFPHINGLEVVEPACGNAFNFDVLKDCKFLVVCTSTMYGYPPKNEWNFAYQLLRGATEFPGCLSHLQHAVFGNGDNEKTSLTYMNCPRYIDILLEQCGSRRFFARGERHEPHADLGIEDCSIETWAKGMWQAVPSALEKGPRATPIPWDGLWEKHENKQGEEAKHKVIPFALDDLQKKMHGKFPKPPSIFTEYLLHNVVWSKL